MKKAFLVLISLVVVYLWGGNSIFSYDGYPIRYFGNDIYSMGMGNAGSSDIFRYNTGYANPALANRNNKTLFGTGFIAGYTYYKSDENGVTRSFRDDALDFPFFSMSIPVKRHRLGFQFNSHSSGLVQNQKSVTATTVEKQETDKYIYRADVIYSYNLSSINLGISGNYYFGHDFRTFEQSSSGNMASTESMLKNFKNPTLTIGILKTYLDHSFGAYGTLPVTLEGESTRSSSHTTEEPIDFEYKLPLELGFGYTGKIARNLKVSIDGNYEAYQQIDTDLRDGWKIGGGLAYEPKLDSGKKWWKTLPLRAGLAYRALPFSTSPDAFVSEYSVSAGVSLPLKGDINRVDIALQYLNRGDIDTNKLNDNSLMLMFGFTGFDVISKAFNRTAPREIPAAEELDRW